LLELACDGELGDRPEHSIGGEQRLFAARPVRRFARHALPEHLSAPAFHRDPRPSFIGEQPLDRRDVRPVRRRGGPGRGAVRAACRRLAKRRISTRRCVRHKPTASNREQAIFYPPTRWLDPAGRQQFCPRLPRPFQSRIPARPRGPLLEFVGRADGRRGRLPMIEMRTTRLDRHSRAIRGTGAGAAGGGVLLFGRLDFAARVKRFQAGARLMLGDGAATEFERLKTASCRRLTSAAPRCPRGACFRRAELSAGRRPWQPRRSADHGRCWDDGLPETGCARSRRRRCRSRSGSAARELLLDPGTTIPSQPRWRAYLPRYRGTNTVRVGRGATSRSRAEISFGRDRGYTCARLGQRMNTVTG